MIGIYAIFRKSDDKCMYVGQSKRLEGRIYDHLNHHATNTNFNNIEYYGKILETFEYDDKDKRLDAEVKWINKLNPKLNVHIDRHYNSGEENPMYGKSGADNPMFNKKHSVLSRKKMSEKRKGEHNPMYGKNPEDYMTLEAIKLKRQKDSEAIKRLKWINNGVVSKRVPKEELDKYIQSGWQLGRLTKKCIKNL